MDEVLKVNKPRKYQRLLCFFNLYHPYKVWNQNNKTENYRHVRRCTDCGKLQEKSYYVSGYRFIANPWTKVDKDTVREPNNMINLYK